MLGSSRNDVSEATSNDEDRVAISTDTVEYVSNFPLPKESKVVQDKYETFPVSCYSYSTINVLTLYTLRVFRCKKKFIN